MPSQLGTAAGYAFQQWLRAQVRSKESAPNFPRDPSEVPSYQQAVRRILEEAAGPTPAYDPLEAEIHQAHQRDGYRIEAVSFPTFGGLRMTATAYVPDADEPVPGVLAVHGHSKHGRRDARNQQRCAALAKAGYFVLAVDAVGNGERSLELPGSYHGGHLAGALWLTGYSLFGIQIHENVRACDYLVSRPEVDATRLAISGASGGGNQSFYSGAWDERFAAVVPVCSMGAYRKLVASFNCMCETPYGIAGSLEQFDVMGLIAPRALLVVSARVDNVSFRFEDAGANTEQASRIWKLLGAEERIRFDALATAHGYPKEAREACLGWFARWLKDARSSAPVPEEDVPIEDYATISCYPESTVSCVMTLPEFFAQRRDEVRPASSNVELSVDDVRDIFAPPTKRSLDLETVDRLPNLADDLPGALRVYRSDEGELIPVSVYWPDFTSTTQRIVMMVGDQKEQMVKTPLAKEALRAGATVWAVDLPGLGEARLPGEVTEYVENLLGLHGVSSASRACHLLGLCLAGYWVSVIQSLADHVPDGVESIKLVASGGPATVVLAGAALLDRVERVTVFNPLITYCRDDQFSGIPFEAFIPNLLMAGDIPDFVAAAAPKPVTIVSPLASDGTQLPVPEARRILQPVAACYEQLGSSQSFHVLGAEEASTSPLLQLIQ